ncbi:5-dehydro-2-deoxygluconokinase [Enterococcus canintestini]|uniref:5-dehydro-2-deoxygluconokinase n=1 Tax=Enterococcus canintestini TaxID=317010 RepID=UPI000BA281D2|nr:5-dehydro-2-deoxygluconokinase [Enterococcus canintestini]
MKKFSVVALGRACIDLNAVEINQPMEETATFKKYVGGSPANIAIGLAKLGQPVGFIGKISDDQHGYFIKNFMSKAGVDSSQLIFDQDGHKTGLAFTEIKSPSECSILMYRQEVADLFLTPDEVSEEYIMTSEMLLISGTALARTPSREATLLAVEYAHKHDVKVIFELDYRPYTWTSTVETAVYYNLLAQKSHIVIGTREEFDILENVSEGNNQETVKKLFQHTPELILIKHGVDGSFAYEKNGVCTRGYAYKADVLKTFGAGDSYAAAFLFALLQGKTLENALQYASAASALVVSRHSSSEAMPSVAEIETVIAKQTWGDKIHV